MEVGSYALAIHTIRHPTMSGYAMTEIFDIERPLETRREEAAEWCHERRETCHDEKVELVVGVRNGLDVLTNLLEI